jgi:hypothetical protein
MFRCLGRILVQHIFSTTHGGDEMQNAQVKVRKRVTTTAFGNSGGHGIQSTQFSATPDWSSICA